MKLHKKLIVMVAVVIALGALATVVLASGIKWGQPPVIDPNSDCFLGWDERSIYEFGPIVADDWLSFGQEPVVDIHWWGSYAGWDGQNPPLSALYGFRIGIWSDVPAGGETEFSHPGEMLWEHETLLGEFAETWAGCDFYAPMMDYPESCFKYDLILADGFQPNPDTIYWVSIAALYDGGPPSEYVWGWTTRPHYFNDDAVRIFNPVAPTPGVVYVDGEPIEEEDGTSWDMAFLLTTEDPQSDLDFGDAPEDPEAGLNYPTTISNDGARHSGLPTRLGIHWDSELDGQPTLPADGDDILDGSDDEDGVFFTTPLVPGEMATVIVEAQGPIENCALNAWIDYDQSGWWDHPGPEHIIHDVNIVPNVLTPLSFVVPGDAVPGETYARFRCSMTRGLPPWHDQDIGIPDGEVEDYRIQIERPRWQKMIQVNEEPWVPWMPDFLLTVETSNTITIVDTVYLDPPQAFGLWETWDPDHLQLIGYDLTAGSVQVFSDTIVWNVPAMPEPAVLTKTFHVEPCNWKRTFIEEELVPEQGNPEVRPITIHKLQPQLDIDSVYDTEVYAGDPATFTLVYSNTGGFENAFSIENWFPPEAPFLSANPSPDAVAPDGSWVQWVFTDGLATGEMGTIDVEVEISETLPVSTIIEIWDSIFDHTGAEVDTVITMFHVDSILDWGDAPDYAPTGPGYPTLDINDGARHIVGGPFMGSPPDTEGNGQPTPNADGDDTDGYDDEDGVYLPSWLFPGDPAVPVTVDLTGSDEGCYLNAWVDFNADYDWDDDGEHIFEDVWLDPGFLHALTFPVPFDVTGTGIIAARFRCSSATGLTPLGEAPDGEVEDYPTGIEPGQLSDVDFGDAPDNSELARYPTLLMHDGARHKIVENGPFMTGFPDPEPDGQPHPSSIGDDVNGNDDERGVFFHSFLISGDPAAPVDVGIGSNNGCYLNAWMDFNQDDDWNDRGEHVFQDLWLTGAMTHTLTFPVPHDAVSGAIFTRFRCSSQEGLAPTGPAYDGEVEDHLVGLENVGLDDVDFGDAPQIDTQPYPTYLSANGARHKIIAATPFMGSPPDPEIDGQPTMGADGDDMNGADDEDGVIFPGPLVQGDTSAPVEIDLSNSNLGCNINAWMDFNGDGDWDDADEQIFTDLWLSSGMMHPLTFTIPGGAALGETYARFRCSSQTGLLPIGPALDGEVEDYLVVIEPPPTFELTPEEEVVQTPYAQHVYTLTLTNNDTAADTFDLSYLASDTSALVGTGPDYEWQVELSTMTVTVGSSASVDFTALVLIPTFEDPWVTQTLTVTATSQSYGTSRQALLVTSSACRFDFSDDHIVDFTDILIIYGFVGSTSALHYDINHDGIVDLTDLLIVYGRVGATCP